MNNKEITIRLKSWGYEDKTSTFKSQEEFDNFMEHCENIGVSRDIEIVTPVENSNGEIEYE